MEVEPEKHGCDSPKKRFKLIMLLLEMLAKTHKMQYLQELLAVSHCDVALITHEEVSAQFLR